MTQSQPAPAAVLDALNALLESEQNSIFRFMDEGSPYLSRATAEVREPLAEMVAASRRHAERLANLIDALGGTAAPRRIQLEEQYLAFLSLAFLLPKLAEAKKIAIERYDSTLLALGKIAAAPEVIELLKQRRCEHEADLRILQRVAADVARSR